MNLTPRELEISRLVAQGYEYKAIADKLGVSLCTIKARMRYVYARLRIDGKFSKRVKLAMILEDNNAKSTGWIDN